MSDVKDNSGPAFPCDTKYDVTGKVLIQIGSTGMTIRDLMAIEAMNGELSAGVLPTSDIEIKAHAIMYYKIADAMLEARNA